MEPYFPDRWEVSELNLRVEGSDVSGTIKIHCKADEKNFLSDFSARVDEMGGLENLTLDGVNVGKYIGRLHEQKE